MTSELKKRWVARAGWILFLAVNCTLPAWWFRRGADAWFGNDRVQPAKLAAALAHRIDTGVGLADFHTGHAQFDGEWLFGSYLMAGLGFLQSAAAHPAAAAPHLARAHDCAEKILAPAVRAFDRASWGGKDPLDALGTAQDHAAYLGYLNVLLGFERLLDPQNSHAALNDRVAAHLAARMEATPGLLLESYPGERYPVDNCAAIAGIALHQRATGADHRALLARWSERCRGRWIDPKSGVLFQAWSAEEDQPCDAPRGSGTALGLYFLSFADPALSRDLYAALARSLGDGLLGFGAFREYPPGRKEGRGDIDSGPVVFGLGLSATGFGLAGARMYGDRDRFARLYSSAALAGAAVERDGRFEFTTGGPLGNAILFAMLTALPPERLPAGRAAP